MCENEGGCQCHQIGGPFIAEDPNCEIHRSGGLEDQLEEIRTRLSELEKGNERLREGLRDAICFMKDAKKVSIKSRGIQLEAEFFGGRDV